MCKRIIWFGVFVILAILSFASNLAAAANNGQPESYPIALTPPDGWVVSQNNLGMSLVIQHPMERPDGRLKATFYRPNITVTVHHKPRFVDKAGAMEFITELRKRYSDMGMESADIQPEYTFFDYKGQDKGLVVYAIVNINDIKITQMHVLISGAEKSAILTYSDLTERFGKDEALFNSVWSSILTARLEGDQPHRYSKLIQNGVLGLIVLILLIIIVSLRQASVKKMTALDGGLADEGSVKGQADDETDDDESEIAEAVVIDESDDIDDEKPAKKIKAKAKKVKPEKIRPKKKKAAFMDDDDDIVEDVVAESDDFEDTKPASKPDSGFEECSKATPCFDDFDGFDDFGDEVGEPAKAADKIKKTGTSSF
jgi:hypothetical protein